MLPDVLVFAFEGGDDKVVYQKWIGRLRPEMIYEPFPCRGKKQVLELRDVVARDLGGLGHRLYFFVDRDFDDLAGYAPTPSTFMTDAYSVENYLVSREVLREVLKVEFHCHGRPDIRESIVAGFDRAYSEFLAVTRNLNRRLFVGRRLGIIAGSTPDKLADVATVELEQVTASERAVEEIVPFAVEPDSAEVAILDGLFAELDAATRYRGKYALSFFERWLSLLADEYASSTSTTFGDIDRKEKVRRSEIVLGGLASKSSMPQQLSEFLAAVEPAVGQGA